MARLLANIGSRTAQHVQFQKCVHTVKLFSSNCIFASIPYVQVSILYDVSNKLRVIIHSKCLLHCSRIVHTMKGDWYAYTISGAGCNTGRCWICLVLTNKLYIHFTVVDFSFTVWQETEVWNTPRSCHRCYRHISEVGNWLSNLTSVCFVKDLVQRSGKASRGKY
jgi:hypothetical protein